MQTVRNFLIHCRLSQEAAYAISLAFHLQLFLKKFGIMAHNNTKYLEGPGLVTRRPESLPLASHSPLWPLAPLYCLNLLGSDFLAIAVVQASPRLYNTGRCWHRLTPHYLCTRWKICTYHSLALAIIQPSVRCGQFILGKAYCAVAHVMR